MRVLKIIITIIAVVLIILALILAFTLPWKALYSENCSELNENECDFSRYCEPRYGSSNCGGSDICFSDYTYSHCRNK